MNTDIWNYLNNKIYFECEIKTVYKRVIEIEPDHLNDWFIQEQNPVMLLRDAKTELWLSLELFLSKYRKKSKCGVKNISLLTNFLFIELL